MRAWDCFYNSYDFGSAVYNAVRYHNSFTRQIASLVGLIAEAMYGCEYYFVKEKFAHNAQTRLEIDIPEAIEKAYPEELKALRKDYRENRVFFRKNDALTNVERHSFIPCTSHYEGLTLMSDSFRKVLFAFHTDWENRFGFYLDNGWIYCYRSGFCLGRFRIAKRGDAIYSVRRAANHRSFRRQKFGGGISLCVSFMSYSRSNVAYGKVGAD